MLNMKSRKKGVAVANDESDSGGGRKEVRTKRRVSKTAQRSKRAPTAPVPTLDSTATAPPKVRKKKKRSGGVPKPTGAPAKEQRSQRSSQRRAKGQRRPAKMMKKKAAAPAMVFDEDEDDEFHTAGSSNSSRGSAVASDAGGDVADRWDGTTTVSLDLTARMPTVTSTLEVALPQSAGLAGGGRGGRLEFVIQSPNIEIIPWSELNILGKLGAGGQASVLHAEWRFSDVAVKVVESVESQQQVAMILEEVAVLCTLRHTNTILCMGVCSEPASAKLAIVTEYMAGGDLFALIHGTPRRQVALATRLNILFDALKGLHYLHATPAVGVHRDIKPSNILLSQRLDAKLADFGIAGSKSAATAGMCTYRYASPQVLQREEATPADDVYAMGLVMVELLSDPPVRPFAWMSDARDRLSTNVYTFPYANNAVPLGSIGHLLPDLVAVIADCFGEPAERPTTDALLTTLQAARRAVGSLADPFVPAPAGPLRTSKDFAAHMQRPAYDVPPPSSNSVPSNTDVVPPPYSPPTGDEPHAAYAPALYGTSTGTATATGSSSRSLDPLAFAVSAPAYTQTQTATNAYAVPPIAGSTPPPQLEQQRIRAPVLMQQQQQQQQQQRAQLPVLMQQEEVQHVDAELFRHEATPSPPLSKANKKRQRLQAANTRSGVSAYQKMSGPPM